MKKVFLIKKTHVCMRGFEYLFYSSLSLSLLVVMILLPIAPVFASEIDGTDHEVSPPASPSEESIDVEESNEEVDTPEVAQEENNVSPEESHDNAESVEGTLSVENTEVHQSTVESEPVNDEPQIVVEEQIDEDQLSSTSTVSETGNGDDGTEETEATTTSSESLPTIEDNGTTTDAEPAVIPEIVTDATTTMTADLTQEAETVLRATSTEATTTTEIGEVITVDASSTNVVMNDDNHFMFAKNECTTVGDGTFYCTKVTEQPVVTHTDRVFSAHDEEGDKEIFIEKDSTIVQITTNQYDDEAPYYDELSNTLVWHRLLDGRYQIVSYDLDSSTETQLTNDRFNNMEPNRYGKVTVWQGWVGNDWEIFLQKDGSDPVMITDNNTHDIAPSINGDYIVWQSFEADAWKMKVYNTQTKTIETVEDSAGGSIENPRFVLVYDTKLETGDIETHGYDLESKEVVQLGSVPAPVPKEIPDPEQTGEKRALVVTPTQPKTKVDGDDDVTPNGIPPADDDVHDGDVVIPPHISDDIIATSTTLVSSNDVPEITIPSFDSQSTTSTDHIEDIIITPYAEPIETALDAQVGVASST